MGWDYVSHVLASPAPLYGRLQQACQAVRQEPLVGLLEYVPPFVRLIDCQLRAYSVDALLRYAAEAMPRQPHQVAASSSAAAAAVAHAAGQQLPAESAALLQHPYGTQLPGDEVALQDDLALIPREEEPEGEWVARQLLRPWRYEDDDDGDNNGGDHNDGDANDGDDDDDADSYFEDDDDHEEQQRQQQQAEPDERNRYYFPYDLPMGADINDAANHIGRRPDSVVAMPPLPEIPPDPVGRMLLIISGFADLLDVLLDDLREEIFWRFFSNIVDSSFGASVLLHRPSLFNKLTLQCAMNANDQLASHALTAYCICCHAPETRDTYAQMTAESPFLAHLLQALESSIEAFSAPTPVFSERLHVSLLALNWFGGCAVGARHLIPHVPRLLEAIRVCTARGPRVMLLLCVANLPAYLERDRAACAAIVAAGAVPTLIEAAQTHSVEGGSVGALMGLLNLRCHLGEAPMFEISALDMRSLRECLEYALESRSQGNILWSPNHPAQAVANLALRPEANVIIIGSGIVPLLVKVLAGRARGSQVEPPRDQAFAARALRLILQHGDLASLDSRLLMCLQEVAQSGMTPMARRETRLALEIIGWQPGKVFLISEDGARCGGPKISLMVATKKMDTYVYHGCSGCACWAALGPLLSLQRRCRQTLRRMYGPAFLPYAAAIRAMPLPANVQAFLLYEA